VGPAGLHLDLPVATWATEGLLAIFFFVVGVELVRELVVGNLRDPRRAAVPVVAAIGGMAVPAGIYLLTLRLAGDTVGTTGWAIPTATDIAFALAVLAVVGRGLPAGVRTFLLTLAVVDDLLGIVIIAVFYADALHLGPLALAAAGVLAFGWLARTRWARWWVLIPVALVTWAALHSSGVQPAVAGALLGLSVPARPVHGERSSRAHRYEELVRPLSAGVALPVFALFAAGVSFSGGSGDVLAEPVFLAVLAGLVVGKPLGVLVVTTLATRLTGLRLPPGVTLRDLLPIGLLTGVGFTVSLLIAELSFSEGPQTAASKLGVLAGSLLAAVGAAVALRLRAQRVRRARTAAASEASITSSRPSSTTAPASSTTVTAVPGSSPSEANRSSRSGSSSDTRTTS
jgi:NhaA family Na+:H+ antiporter